MRRWFLGFLTLLLCAQFGWAAAASYCAHASDTVAPRHLGHHVHDHEHAAEAQTQSKAQDLGADRQLPFNDLDHGHCHLLHVVVGAQAYEYLAPALASRAVAQRWPMRASHIPQGLDRPNWLRT